MVLRQTLNFALYSVNRYGLTIDDDVKKHIDRIVEGLHAHARTTLKDASDDQNAGHAEVAKIPGVVADTSLNGTQLPLPGDRYVSFNSFHTSLSDLETHQRLLRNPKGGT